MRHIVICVVALSAIVACGGTSPTVPGDAKTTATTPAKSVGGTEEDNSVAEIAPENAQEVIPALDAPKVPQTEIASNSQEVVCERVRRTGSHRATRICRTRGEIERDALAGKETFDELYESQRRQGEH